MFFIENVQPGYIDPDVIAHSLHKKPRKAGNGMEFRFAQKQDDEYYNPNSGVILGFLINKGTMDNFLFILTCKEKKLFL